VETNVDGPGKTTSQRVGDILERHTLDFSDRVT
jgi:hypothetical protein